LVDRVKVLHPTRHKIGHIADVLPSQSLGIVLKNVVTCRRDHVTAAVTTLLKVVNFTKFTAVLQPESKCLFIKEVKVLESCYRCDELALKILVALIFYSD